MFEASSSEQQAQLILSSYTKLFGDCLITIDDTISVAQQLYEAPMVVLSHGIEKDPVFNFGSAMALERFELSWSQLTKLPSRFSAEAPNRADREKLLSQVNTHGYIDDYQGIRISSSGKRFMIRQAKVWNLTNSVGQFLGQAAAFDKWLDL